MDSSSLQALVTVVDSLSFSEAARRLHLTQPAISKRIANLESQLNVRLLERLGRRVRLTEAGRSLLPQIRRILDDMEALRRHAVSQLPEVSGSLLMGTSHHIGLYRLPPVLREYRQRHAQVHLDLRFIDSEDAYAAVRRGDLELGLLTLPPNPDPRLHNHLLWRDDLIFVAAHGHALAQVPGRLHLADLANWPALLPAPLTFTRQIVEGVFRARQLRLQVDMTTHHLDTLRMMVELGLGWSVLPATMLSAGLRVLDVDTPALYRQLGIVYHPERSLSRAAHAMLELLAAYGDAPTPERPG